MKQPILALVVILTAAFLGASAPGPPFSNVLAYTTPGMERVTVRETSYRSAGPSALALDIHAPPGARPEGRLPVVVFALGYADDAAQALVGGRLKDFAPYVSWARLVAARGAIGVTYGKSKGVRAAVFYDGLMPTPDGFLQEEMESPCRPRGCVVPPRGAIARLHRDVPILVVRAGRDAIPHVDASIEHFVTLARATDLPVTLRDFPEGVHGFDFEQKAATEGVRGASSPPP
jgi:hypothetical protein